MPELIKEVSTNVRRISAEQAAAEMPDKNALFIDVREPGEHQKLAAEGSINIPRGILEGKILELEKDATRAIYLHCAAGVRATLAAEQLQRLGYENVTAISCKFDAVKASF